jgi:hypothetical protein
MVFCDWGGATPLQILFESLFCAEDLSEIHPQIHPGKNVQADENIEIFVAPSASRVCIQHLISKFSARTQR